MSEEVEEEGFDMSLLESDYSGETQEPAEAEPVEEAEVEQELPAEEPQSDPSDAMQERWDKSLQELDQLKATLSKEVGKLQQQGDTPTEKQVERVEKAQSKLDKYLKETDIDPYAAPREISEEVIANRDRAERAMQDYEGKLRALEERMAQREAQSQEQLVRLQFKADYPDLAGRYDEFASKVQEQMESQYGSAVNEMTDAVYGAIANQEFLRLVGEAQAASTPTEPTITDTAKKPKATQPIKTKSGSKAPAPMSSEAQGEALLAQIAQEFHGRGAGS